MRFSESIIEDANIKGLQPDKTHPADSENPGRVKVQFIKDNRFLNPIIKNRQ